MLNYTRTGNNPKTTDMIKAGRAAGAEYITDLVLDYRGLSFAMGAEKNLTLQASLFSMSTRTL